MNLKHKIYFRFPSLVMNISVVCIEKANSDINIS